MSGLSVLSLTHYAHRQNKQVYPTEEKCIRNRLNDCIEAYASKHINVKRRVKLGYSVYILLIVAR